MGSHKRSIGFTVKGLANQIDRVLHSSPDETEKKMTGMQHAVLGFVGNSGGAIFQKDVEKEFNVRGATATGILQLMEKNGLITRKTEEGDARRKCITITPLGQAQFERAGRNIKRMEDALSQGFTAEEIEQFYSFTERMKQNLKNLEEPQK